MTVVVSFRNWKPPARYDDLPWTDVYIQEAALEAGPWPGTLVDTVALDPLDEDPADPESRSFTTDNGTSDALWYGLVFVDAALATSAPTDPIQNVAAVAPYATQAELQRILKLPSAGAAQLAAMDRVLLASSLEIDAELGLEDPFEEVPALVVEVCLERAVEHWRQMESPFGVLGLGGVETATAFTGRDTWDRHAHKLAPLKESWGMA
jgi:hypothetical protein